MAFKVTDASGNTLEYTDDDKKTLNRETGILTISTADGTRRVYSRVGWLSIEEPYEPKERPRGIIV